MLIAWHHIAWTVLHDTPVQARTMPFSATAPAAIIPRLHFCHDNVDTEAIVIPR